MSTLEQIRQQVDELDALHKIETALLDKQIGRLTAQLEIERNMTLQERLRRELQSGKGWYHVLESLGLAVKSLNSDEESVRDAINKWTEIAEIVVDMEAEQHSVEALEEGVRLDREDEEMNTTERREE